MHGWGIGPIDAQAARRRWCWDCEVSALDEETCWMCGGPTITNLEYYARLAAKKPPSDEAEATRVEGTAATGSSDAANSDEE